MDPVGGRLVTRTARIQIFAAFAALLLVTGMVWRVSSAAFTATTANGANSWATGTVALSDSADGTAMFTVSGIKPGETGTACIDVTYDGTLTGTALTNVLLYADTVGTDGDAGTDTLLDHLYMEVVRGAAADDCTDAKTNLTSSTQVYARDLLGNFGADFSTGHDSAWNPGATGESVPFFFTWDLPDTTGNAAQGDGATATFTWEVRSN